MNSIPKINEQIIRQRASDSVWQRGLRYYKSGSIDGVVWRAGLLTAEVQGSRVEPYAVRIQFDESRLSSAECNCPYNQGGDCKHIVAALIYASRHASDIETRPAVETLIAELDLTQLRALIQNLTTQQPQLIDQIERLILQTTTTSNVPPTVAPVQIDAKILQRQITADLRGSINHGYDQWGDTFYDSDLGEALVPACEIVRKQIDSGHAKTALATLEVAIKAWDKGIDSLDEYVIDAFEDVAEEFLSPLADLCAEAILAADLTKKERDKWAAKFEKWSDQVFGGEALEIASTAASAGWDEPLLVAAMQGNVTDQGVWEDDAPYYADELAVIRLKILEQRGQFAEYLNLAQAEGQFMLYLHMLIKQGDHDTAVSEATQHLTRPSSIHALCRTFVEQGELDIALRLAQRGLKLAESEGRSALAAWLRDTARTQNHPELALAAAQQALAENVTLENYQGMQRNAGGSWEALKPQALQMVLHGKSAEKKVDIYLYEGLHKEAIEAVNKASWFTHIERVMDAVKDDYPEWVFQQCRKRADEIMDAGRSKSYHAASEWLTRGRRALLDAGKSAEWARYYDSITAKHRRKYSLMPLLRQLR